MRCKPHTEREDLASHLTFSEKDTAGAPDEAPTATADARAAHWGTLRGPSEFRRGDHELAGGVKPRPEQAAILPLERQSSQATAPLCSPDLISLHVDIIDPGQRCRTSTAAAIEWAGMKYRPVCHHLLPVDSLTSSRILSVSLLSPNTGTRGGLHKVFRKQI